MSTKIKIVTAMIFAIIISTLVFSSIQPKSSDAIPVLPYSMKIRLVQNPDDTLIRKSITLEEGYAPDFQSRFDSNYYTITLKNKDKTLFEGQTVKSNIIISEDFFGEDLKGTIDEEKLGEFTLLLPYFKDATELVITADTGEESLRENLKDLNLETPQNVKNTCGDGICSDRENILMCHADCSYRLPKLFSK